MFQPKKGLSFSSFGSAESRKPSWQDREHTPHQSNFQQQGSRARETYPNGTDDMPPLEDDLQGYGDVPGLVPVGIHDGFDEHDAIRMEQVDQNLLPQVDAMQVGTTPAPRHATSTGKDREPIIQFPEEEEEEEHQSIEKERNQVNIMMNKHILGNMM
jgi:hypothetical protein